MSEERVLELENQLHIVCAELEATQLRLEFERERTEPNVERVNKVKDLVKRESMVHIEEQTCVLS